MVSSCKDARLEAHSLVVFSLEHVEEGNNDVLHKLVDLRLERLGLWYEQNLSAS